MSMSLLELLINQQVINLMARQLVSPSLVNPDALYGYFQCFNEMEAFGHRLGASHASCFG